MQMNQGCYIPRGFTGWVLPVSCGGNTVGGWSQVGSLPESGMLSFKWVKVYGDTGGSDAGVWVGRFWVGAPVGEAPWVGGWSRSRVGGEWVGT